MDINFKFNLNTLVTTKPFKHQGVMVYPKPNERYTIMGRAYTESIAEGHVIQAAIIYYCKPDGVFNAKDKVYTVKESDIVTWEPPKVNPRHKI